MTDIKTDVKSQEPFLESLSALMDGEGSELELRRVLKASEDDPAIRSAWKRYQAISSTMKNDFPAAQTLDLSGSIRELIAEEPQLKGAVPRRERTWLSYLGRFSVAASVAAAVLILLPQVSIEGNNQVADTVEPETYETPSYSVPYEVGPLITRPVSNTVNTANPTSSGLSNQMQPVLYIPSGNNRVNNQELQRHLNQLMLEHAEHSAENSGRGMMPYARVPRLQE